MRLIFVTGLLAAVCAALSYICAVHGIWNGVFIEVWFCLMSFALGIGALINAATFTVRIANRAFGADEREAMETERLIAIRARMDASALPSP